MSPISTYGSADEVAPDELVRRAYLDGTIDTLQLERLLHICIVDGAQLPPKCKWPDAVLDREGGRRI